MFLPKVLYEQMPVIYIYAINTTAGKDSKLYECPIYRKPGRTELNYIGSIGTYTSDSQITKRTSQIQIQLTDYLSLPDFESDIGPRHWVMRGVALLCDIK